MGEPSSTAADAVGPAIGARPTWPAATGPRGGGPTPPSGAWWPTGLAGMGGAGISRCTRRPDRGRGTFADVDRAARVLAGSLQAGGSGPGDVVVFQLPNWVEAGITFWAAAYLGAVVVPIVHFYGAKEVEYILGCDRARRGRDGRPVRAQRLPGHLRRTAGTATGPAVAGGRRHARPPPSPAGPRRSPRCSTATPRDAGSRSTPTPRPSSASPRGRRVTPKAWCTRTGRSAARARQLDYISSPGAARPRSPAHRSGISSACSTPS